MHVLQSDKLEARASFMPDRILLQCFQLTIIVNVQLRVEPTIISFSIEGQKITTKRQLQKMSKSTDYNSNLIL